MLYPSLDPPPDQYWIGCDPQRIIGAETTMAFTCSVLNSYNHLFGNLLTVCQCYERYSSPDRFLRTVCQERNSYMACLDHRSGRRPSINHRSVPVMIGSYIDVRIRGLAEVQRNAHLWGTVILLGAPRTYPNYSAFQPLALHIRETNTDRYLALYTYIDDQGLALVYTRDGQVRYDYRGEYGRTDTHWNELLARSDPDKLAPTHHERTHMFAAMLRESYRRTDLGNRRVISSPHVMHRYVLKRLGRLAVPISAIPATAANGGGGGGDGGGGDEDDGSGEPPPKMRKKQSHANCMCRDFELGRVYSGLGKRATATEAENGRNGRYNQAYDHPMHDGRSSKTVHLLGTVVRDSNAAVRNSNALMFPADAAYFFCPLTTKDLKSAGEQNVLCDMVISSEATPTAPVLHYMRTLDTGAGSVLVLNDTPTRYRRAWNFADLLALKRRFPFVTTRLYQGYVVFYTCDSMPIKYSAEHGCFFGVCETVQANIRYPELDLFSVTAKELPPWSLTRTPPSKLTVSINNIKGGVATLSSELHGQLMRNSLGVTCYMNPPPDYRARLMALAELSGPGSASTEWFAHWYDRLNRAFCLTTTTEDTGAHRRQQPAPTGTPPELALAAVMQLYAGQPTLVESQRPRIGAHTRRFHGENRPLVQRYRAMIGDVRNYGSDANGGVWNMRLYAAFGNPHGDCVEDGVVVDAGTVARMEPVHYNACITVDFTFRAARHHQESTRFVTVSTAAAANGDDRDSLIGYLVTEHEPFIKHSKHTRVDRYRIGKHNYYLVHFLPKSTNMYDDVQARYQINNTALTVVITGRKVVRVGVGSKVANAFGQKNIISAVRDLRHHRGVTRDGRVVHAQIIYSQMSMVGRVTSGQLYDMLTSEDLAIARDGTFMAPVDLVLHNLHPFSNAKCTEIKNDTLTNVNGFDSQGLSVTCLRLRKENTTPRIVRVLGMLGYTVKLQGAREADQLTRAEVAANRARLARSGARNIAAGRVEPPPGGWNITSPTPGPDDGDGGDAFAAWNEPIAPIKVAATGDGGGGDSCGSGDDDDADDDTDDDGTGSGTDDDTDDGDTGTGTGTGTGDDDDDDEEDGMGDDGDDDDLV